MKLSTFLLKLRKFAGEGEINQSGCIRIGCDCPVTLIYNDMRTIYQNRLDYMWAPTAGNRIGLESIHSMLVMEAADNIDHSPEKPHPWQDRVRSILTRILIPCERSEH